MDAALSVYRSTIGFYHNFSCIPIQTGVYILPMLSSRNSRVYAITLPLFHTNVSTRNCPRQLLLCSHGRGYCRRNALVTSTPSSLSLPLSAQGSAEGVLVYVRLTSLFPPTSSTVNGRLLYLAIQ
ncbi:hypothetical protein FKM82_014677 [Ascaphus truei]